MPLTRKVYVVGEISTESYLKFSKSLDRRERENNKPIEIELFSEGGDPIAALAFYGRMRNSKCEIHVKAYGQVASAAVLVLAGGDMRAMAGSAWLMVHEDSAALEGEVTALEKAAKHLRRLEDQWSTLLKGRSNMTMETWNKLHKDTTYLTAKECLISGIIDEVLE